MNGTSSLLGLKRMKGFQINLKKKLKGYLYSFYLDTRTVPTLRSSNTVHIKYFGVVTSIKQIVARDWIGLDWIS